MTGKDGADENFLRKVSVVLPACHCVTSLHPSVLPCQSPAAVLTVSGAFCRISLSRTSKSLALSVKSTTLPAHAQPRVVLCWGDPARSRLCLCAALRGVAFQGMSDSWYVTNSQARARSATCSWSRTALDKPTRSRHVALFCCAFACFGVFGFGLSHPAVSPFWRARSVRVAAAMKRWLLFLRPHGMCPNRSSFAIPRADAHTGGEQSADRAAGAAGAHHEREARHGAAQLPVPHPIVSQAFPSAVCLPIVRALSLRCPALPFPQPMPALVQ